MDIMGIPDCIKLLATYFRQISYILPALLSKLTYKGMSYVTKFPAFFQIIFPSDNDVLD